MHCVVVALGITLVDTGGKRQAIEFQNSGSGHCLRVTPGGRVGSAKRCWCGRRTVRRSGTKFRLATREARQAVLGAELVREEDFYTTLGEVHDAMLWLGAQLQEYLVLG